MTTREAFNHAVKKAFGTITLAAISVTGATWGFEASLFAAKQLFPHISYTSSPAGSTAILTGILVSTVAGGVLSYAAAKAFAHSLRDEGEGNAAPPALARSHKGPNFPAA